MDTWANAPAESPPTSLPCDGAAVVLSEGLGPELLHLGPKLRIVGRQVALAIVLVFRDLGQCPSALFRGRRASGTCALAGRVGARSVRQPSRAGWVGKVWQPHLDGEIRSLELSDGLDGNGTFRCGSTHKSAGYALREIRQDKLLVCGVQLDGLMLHLSCAWQVALARSCTRCASVRRRESVFFGRRRLVTPAWRPHPLRLRGSRRSWVPCDSRPWATV